MLGLPRLTERLAVPPLAAAAAEFVVHGTYLSTDSGLPEARGQTYVLPAGTFFTIRDGKIADIARRTVGGFARGTAKVEGTGEYAAGYDQAQYDEGSYQETEQL